MLFEVGKSVANGLAVKLRFWGVFSLEEQGCWLKTSVEGQSLTVEVDGDWTMARSPHIDGLFGGLMFDGIRNATVDVSGLAALDTAGAHIIHRTMSELDKRDIATELAGLDAAYKPLLTIVTEADDQPHKALHEEPHFILAMFERVGRTFVDAMIEAKRLVNFFGLKIIAFGSAITKPRQLRPIAFISQIEQTGLNAVPINCLLNFLIGGVIAYQGAVQLRQFQAEYKDRLPTETSTLSSASTPSTNRVRINAKLVKMPWREIIAFETFERKVPATRNSMEAIIGAFDESLGKVLKAIVIWTLNNAMLLSRNSFAPQIPKPIWSKHVSRITQTDQNRPARRRQWRWCLHYGYRGKQVPRCLRRCCGFVLGA